MLAKINPGFHGYVFEGAIATIAIKNVVADSSYQKIGISVVVIIRGGYAVRVAASLYSCCHRHVRESAVAVIAIQTVEKFGIDFFEGGRRSAVDKEDIGAAIVVVIECGYTAGHQFDLVELPVCAVIELKVDSSLLSDILELYLAPCKAASGRHKIRREFRSHEPGRPARASCSRSQAASR